MRQRCWITHRRREEWVYCPMCGAEIVWERTSNGYHPCDTLPVLMTYGGKYKAIRHRKVENNCKIYNAREEKKPPFYARMPHYYTCPELKKERREYYQEFIKLGGEKKSSERLQEMLEKAFDVAFNDEKAGEQ